MKHRILTALVTAIALSAAACTPATAAVIATAGNSAGGQIKLTDQLCGDGDIAPGALSMFATSANGKFTNGCWAMNDDGDILVVFENGMSRMYRADQFDVRKAPAKAQKQAAPAAKQQRGEDL